MATQSNHLFRLIRGGAVGAVALVAASATVGCSSSKAKPAAEAPAAITADGTLGAGDELEIKFYYAPELNVQQRVRPDGTISMQLLGDVMAAGLTPTQLDEELQKRYAGQLRFPEVSIIVRAQHSRRVYVTGEVVRPGVVDMPANLSLWEAIITSGGFVTRNADVGQVIVVRQLANGKRQGFAINMNDELAGAGVTPFVLQPMDIVFVPRDPIVNVGDWVDKNINSVIPRTGLRYTTQSGNATFGYDNTR